METLKMNIHAIYSAFSNSSIINGYSEEKAIPGMELRIFRSILRIILAEENYRLPSIIDRTLEHYSRFDFILIEYTPTNENAYFEYLKILSPTESRIIEKTKNIFDGYLLIKNKAKSLLKGNLIRNQDFYQQIYKDSDPLLRLLAYQALEPYLSCNNCQKTQECVNRKPNDDCALWKNDLVIGKALSKTNLHH